MTGAEVETAENGKIAVEKVEASPKGLYDLIFMDIQMPVSYTHLVGHIFANQRVKKRAVQTSQRMLRR